MSDGDLLVDGIYMRDPNKGYGVGGIHGMHHDILGWDNTTVGMASSVFDNLLSQQGVLNLDPHSIGALEPIRAGRFLIKWLTVPSFFNVVVVKYLKFFLENMVRQVEGIQSNTLSESGSVTIGGNQLEMSFPGNLKQNNKEVTLSTITCTGDGLGKVLRYWMYGITDPVTGVHHMYGKDMRYIRPNYTGTLLYVFLGPTARPGDIEYACIWHHVWPSSSDNKDMWNSQELGSDSAISDKDVTFSGIFQDGPEANILAAYIVASAGLSGQSYFDQMLPAYMYKYIDSISGKETANDTIRGISIAQSHKLNSMSEQYTPEILKIREDAISRYGLNSEAIPSKIMTFKENIKEVDTFNSDNWTDPLKNIDVVKAFGKE